MNFISFYPYIFKHILAFTEYSLHYLYWLFGRITKWVYLQKQNRSCLDEIHSCIKQVTDTINDLTKKLYKIHTTKFHMETRNKLLWTVWRNWKWTWKENGSNACCLHLPSIGIPVAFYLFPFPNFWERITK